MDANQALQFIAESISTQGLDDVTAEYSGGEVDVSEVSVESADEGEFWVNLNGLPFAIKVEAL